MKVPEVEWFATPNRTKMYFDNNTVERLLVQYHWTGCTNVSLRNQIMAHAHDLIYGVITTHGLHKICPGCNGAAGIGDLSQVGWIQVERTLYKFRACPHCAACFRLDRPLESVLYTAGVMEYGILSPEQVAEKQLVCPHCGQIPEKITYRGTSKVFNLWSQVSHTSILAYIKKDTRDSRYQDTLKDHLRRDTHLYSEDKPRNGGIIDRFIDEAMAICRHDKRHVKILEALRQIGRNQNLGIGLITELVRMSGQRRPVVIQFLEYIRTRGDCFTDSPFNAKPMPDIEQMTTASD